MSRAAAVRLGWLTLTGGLLHAMLSAYACGGVESGFKRAGEPCTRTTECVSGLVCGAGVCRVPDAGMPMDSGPPDDASVGDDAGG